MQWKGLFNWVNKETKEYEFDSKIPPLTPDQRKFLEEVMDYYTVDECKRMKEIVDYLFNNCFELKEDNVDNIISQLEELQDLLTGIDNSMNLCKMGGSNILFGVYKDCKNKEIKDLCCVILCEMTRNNIYTQKNLFSITYDYFINELKKGVYNESDIYILNTYLTGILIGAKIKFIEDNGLEYLMEKLKNTSNSKLLYKIYQIFTDFLDNDEYFHYDISELNNDIITKKEIPEIRKEELKGVTLNFLNNHKDYFIKILTQLNENDNKTIIFKENYFTFLKVFYNKLKENNMTIDIKDLLAIYNLKILELGEEYNNIKVTIYNILNN